MVYYQTNHEHDGAVVKTLSKISHMCPISFGTRAGGDPRADQAAQVLQRRGRDR